MTAPAVVPPTVEVHLDPGDLPRALEEDVRVGLTASDKWLPPVWFYDDRGSRLFDDITRLPEYYPTRAERLLLQTQAAAVAERSGADPLVELGAGTCDKTRVLLDALRRRNSLRRYVPLDVSSTTLADAADGLAHDYPGLHVHAVVGDFHRHLERLPSGGRRLVAFLGGTIGNLTPDERRRFLFDLDCVMEPHDRLLLGTDLVKDRRRLVAAYDDAAGVTAEFNRNVLHVLNRELGASFARQRVDPVACGDEEASWMEMRLRPTARQSVKILDLDLEVTFEAGEALRTEISANFTRQRVHDELWQAGFVVEEMWDQPGGEFLLTLARPYC